MKIKHLSIAIASLMVVCYSCKKESINLNAGTGPSAPGNSTVPATSYAIAGTWQQTKLVVYMLDNSGKVHYDTTYLQPFTKADFVAFGNTGTGSWGVDHYYYLATPPTPAPTPISPIVTDYLYTPVGSKFVLAPKFNGVGPGGGWSTDTATVLDANTLLIHTVATGNGASTNLFISDSYFTKNQ